MKVVVHDYSGHPGRCISGQKLGPPGAFVGWVAQRFERQVAARASRIVAIADSFLDQLDEWGDGEQTRSFMYVDDCVEGSMRVTAGDSPVPVNVGSSELVSINQMVSIIEQIAGIEVKRNYNLDAPKGVRGRNSDNTLIQEIYGWEPSIGLADGLERLREEQQAELEERCGLLDGVDQHPDADPERALVQVERRLMQVELRTAA